jgi:8-oxo-dGTP pyrophosphatase MutT (NUDIX family)
MKNQPVKTISIKKIYKNKWLDLEEHKVVTGDGKEHTYGVLDYGDGVSILSVDDSKNIFLIKEYKYAVKKYMYQLPAGTVEKGEAPLLAAKREFLEETGLKAGKWKFLGTTNPFPTNITTTVSLYLATNLKQVQEPEYGIRLHKFSLAKVKQMVAKNKITHSGTLVCLLKYFNQEKI